MKSTRRIRADARFAKLPVIAMTAHAMLGDRERFLEAGMSDYIAKPIEEAQLFEVLSRWVKKNNFIVILVLTYIIIRFLVYFLYRL